MVPKVLFLVLLGAALVLASPVSKENDDTAVNSEKPVIGTDEKVSTRERFVTAAQKQTKNILRKFDAMTKEKREKFYKKLVEYTLRPKKYLGNLKKNSVHSIKKGKELYNKLITKQNDNDDKENDNKKKETPKN